MKIHKRVLNHLVNRLDEAERRALETERELARWQRKAQVIAENAAAYQDEIKVLKQRIAGLEAEIAKDRKCQGDH